MRHHLVDRPLQWHAAEHDALHHVGLRQHANRRAIAIDHNYRASFVFAHDLHRALDRRGTGDRNGGTLDECVQRCVERLLRAGLLGITRLQLLARLGDETGQITAAIARKSRADFHQLMKLGGRQLQHLQICQRGIAVGRRPAAGQGANRKTFSDRQGDARHAINPGFRRQHLPARQNEQRLRLAQIGRHQDIAGNKASGFQVQIKKRQRLGLETVKRRVKTQKLGINGGRGGHGKKSRRRGCVL